MSSGTTTKTPLRAFWQDLPREGKLLLSVVVVEFVGNGLVLPFWVVYLHEVRGFSLPTAGLLIGVQPLVGLVAAVPGGGLIDRLGARIVMVGGLFLLIAGEVVMAFAATVPLAVLAFALSGMAFGVSFPGSQTLIATIVPSPIRQRYYGLNFSLLNLGIGIGGLVGGAFVDVDRLWTFQAIYLVDALTFLAPLFVLLVPLRHVSGRAEHDVADAAKPSYREVIRLPGMRTLVLLTFVASFVAYGQLNSGMPAFARNVAHVSTRGLGLAFAANTLVIVLLQLVVLQRIEGRRRTRVMVVMAAVWAVSWALLGASGLVPDTWGATVLVAACASVFALGETLLQPTLPAITNDLTSDRLRGRSNALASIAFQLPMVLAPPVAGWLIGHDHQVLYVVGLLVGCALLAVLVVTRLEPALTPAANGLVAPPHDPPEGPPTTRPTTRRRTPSPTPSRTPPGSPDVAPACALHTPARPIVWSAVVRALEDRTHVRYRGDVTLDFQASLDLDPVGLGDLAGRVERRRLSAGAWVDVLPGWLTGADEVFADLVRDVPWRAERRAMYDGVVDVPRLLCYYDAGRLLPHPVLEAARDALTSYYADELGEPFVTAGCCYYRDGRDSVAWHGDRIGRGRSADTMVAIVSLGEPRRLSLRPVGGMAQSPHSVAYSVGHGDLIVMGGSCQRTWEHAILKTSRPVGPRISIQLRPRNVF